MTETNVERGNDNVLASDGILLPGEQPDVNSWSQIRRRICGTGSDRPTIGTGCDGQPGSFSFGVISALL